MSVRDYLQILPTEAMLPITNKYMDYYYTPVAKWLEKQAELLPLALTPNRVTVLATLTCVPALLSEFFGWHWFCAFWVLAHEFLDFMDGCIARSYLKRGLKHDGNFGAFLDAMYVISNTEAV